MDTTVNVMYETPEQAKQAMDQLDNYEYKGSQLKVEFMSNGTRGPRPDGNRSDGRPKGPPRNSGNTNNRGSGNPLRILVPSEYVGAIIGRKGSTIRNITTQSRARVDVHRDDNAGMLEKVISIYGQQENCTNACKEILKVMQQEAASTNRPGEIALKMLADNSYCGRIIGKEGRVIQKIREDTDTRITVSNVQDMQAMCPDRVITIRGSIDNMSSAESCISTKLKECIEKDMQTPGMMMPGSFPGMQMMSSGMYGIMPYGMSRPGYPYGNQGMYSPMQPHPQHPQHPQQPLSPSPHGSTHEMIQICVPSSSVGALIGSKGANIKNVIKDSGARVSIEPQQGEDTNPAADRMVTIRGCMESQWRASYHVFDKLAQEGFASMDDTRLRTCIRIPKSMVGRVIGKGGKNVSKRSGSH